MVLQMLTAKPAMVDDKELVEVVEDAFKRERSALALADASARWPRDAFLEIARVAKKCIKPKRAQRPSLAAVSTGWSGSRRRRRRPPTSGGQGEDMAADGSRAKGMIGTESESQSASSESRVENCAGWRTTGRAEPAPEPVRAMTLPRA